MILTKYRWLATNVPEVLNYYGYRWESWLKNLTELDKMDLRMNITGIKHYRYLIEDSDEFEYFIGVHTHLVELLFCLEYNK